MFAASPTWPSVARASKCAWSAPPRTAPARSAAPGGARRQRRPHRGVGRRGVGRGRRRVARQWRRRRGAGRRDTGDAGGHVRAGAWPWCSSFRGRVRGVGGGRARKGRGRPTPCVSPAPSPQRTKLRRGARTSSLRDARGAARLRDALDEAAGAQATAAEGRAAGGAPAVERTTHAADILGKGERWQPAKVGP